MKHYTTIRSWSKVIHTQSRYPWSNTTKTWHLSVLLLTTFIRKYMMYTFNWNTSTDLKQILICWLLHYFEYYWKTWTAKRVHTSGGLISARHGLPFGNCTDNEATRTIFPTNRQTENPSSDPVHIFRVCWYPCCDGKRTFLLASGNAGNFPGPAFSKELDKAVWIALDGVYAVFCLILNRITFQYAIRESG